MSELLAGSVTAGAIPVPDADSLPFWEGCRDHRLLLQRCEDCSRLRFPPSPVCSHCRSWETLWEEVPPRGEVYSWIVVHHAVTQALQDDVPYAVALVEIAAGVRIPGRLSAIDFRAIHAGMPVRVIFHEVDGPWPIPGFIPVGDEAR